MQEQFLNEIECGDEMEREVCVSFFRFKFTLTVVYRQGAQITRKFGVCAYHDIFHLTRYSGHYSEYVVKIISRHEIFRIYKRFAG